MEKAYWGHLIQGPETFQGFSDRLYFSSPAETQQSLSLLKKDEDPIRVGSCLSRSKLSAAAQLPSPGFILIAPLPAHVPALGYRRIMEYPMMEETHRDHWVHIPLNLQLLDRFLCPLCLSAPWGHLGCSGASSMRKTILNPEFRLLELSVESHPNLLGWETQGEKHFPKLKDLPRGFIL